MKVFAWSLIVEQREDVSLRTWNWGKIVKTPTEKAKYSPRGSLSKDRDGQCNVPKLPCVSEFQVDP